MAVQMYLLCYLLPYIWGRYELDYFTLPIPSISSSRTLLSSSWYGHDAIYIPCKYSREVGWIRQASRDVRPCDEPIGSRAFYHRIRLHVQRHHYYMMKNQMVGVSLDMKTYPMVERREPMGSSHGLTSRDAWRIQPTSLLYLRGVDIASCPYCIRTMTSGFGQKRSKEWAK
jgi:hypothetical protein